MKNKLLFFPKYLDIKRVIQNDVELTEKQKEIGIKYYQRVLYPVSRIIQEYRLNKTFKDDIIEDAYVTLNIEILRKIFGSNRLYWIMPFLLRNGIIKKNKKRYYSGSHSDSYRLGDKYIDYKYISKEFININTDKTLFNNLEKNKYKKNKYTYKVEKMLNMIDIDSHGAMVLLNKKYDIIKNKHIDPKKWLNKRFINEYFDSINDLDLISDDKEKYNMYNTWMMSILKIVNQDFFVTIGENSGRIFTNLTSLPRELRQFIYVKTPKNTSSSKKHPKRLEEVDIANSQPFLFNKFLLENFDIDGDLFGDKYEDIRKYIQLTSEGKLYEYVMDYCGRTDRNLFKKEFFGSIFYCKKSSNFRNKNSKIFGELFPNVMSLIIKMKEGSYKNLSIQLQKFEVEVIVNYVSKKLFELNVEHFTIHDSILCHEEHKPLVKSLIDEKLKEYGLKGTIKTK